MRRLPVAGLAAAAAAALANLLVYLIERFVFGLPLVVPMGGPGGPEGPVTAVMVIVTSAVPAICAALLLAALARFTSRPFRILLIVAIVFGLLSLAGPLLLPVSLGTRLALALMHIVAGVTIVGILNQMARAA
jgi:hypothetical protein